MFFAGSGFHLAFHQKIPEKSLLGGVKLSIQPSKKAPKMNEECTKAETCSNHDDPVEVWNLEGTGELVHIVHEVGGGSCLVHNEGRSAIMVYRNGGGEAWSTNLPPGCTTLLGNLKTKEYVSIKTGDMDKGAKGWFKVIPPQS